MKNEQIIRLMNFKKYFHLNDNNEIKKLKNNLLDKLSFSVELNIDYMYFKYKAFNFPLKDKYCNNMIHIILKFLAPTHEIKDFHSIQ